MNEGDPREHVLRELILQAQKEGAYPEIQTFRVSHEEWRATIDEVQRDGLILDDWGRYRPTLEALRASELPEARDELNAAGELIPLLQQAFRKGPGQSVSAWDLASQAGRSVPEIQRALAVLSHLSIFSVYIRDEEIGLADFVAPEERVLDTNPEDVTGGPEEDLAAEALDLTGACLQKIEVDGYRPFRELSAEPGDLTVLIGANATGKSSLFDFLRFLGQAVQDPLPPEIDERSAGKRLFHAGGAEAIRFALNFDLGQTQPVRYEAEILGPIGRPVVARESLATIKPLLEEEARPFIFLEFKAGRGVVRDQQQRKLVRPNWTVKPNELALRRALDPTLVTLSRVQSLMSSWCFYSGFDVSTTAAMRRPALTEPSPTLSERGDNLSAVLMWLKTEHSAVWDELETHLASCLPGFRSLSFKAHGGPGMVIGTLRETGVEGELTLADLSDGTLRLLCWAVVCLSPEPPPLICADEPELGLHPRVLPVLAGLFRQASARTQVLVATHSPYFLSHFALDEIAVMRKADGAAQFVRPSSSNALRAEVKEIGGEALMRLHLSDELETLS